MTQQIVFIALGGACGAVLRFLLSGAAAGWFGRGFPYGTLLVNTLGSFAIGVLFVILSEKLLAGPGWRSFLIVGLLGALTTFSTFSIETLALLESGEVGRALLNVLLNVVLCLLACGLGLIMMRNL